MSTFKKEKDFNLFCIMKISHISKNIIISGEEIKGREIRLGIFQLIQQDYPDFSKEDYITLTELNRYRRLYLTYLMRQEKGELALLDQDVLHAIQNNAILSENIQEEIEKRWFIIF